MCNPNPKYYPTINNIYIMWLIKCEVVETKQEAISDIIHLSFCRYVINLFLTRIHQKYG
jgi:hypothetical protein